MKYYTSLLLVSLVTFSCTRLTSTDIELATNCDGFQEELIKQIQAKKIAHLHYIGIERDNCTLVLKYEKGQVDIDEIKQVVIENKYHFIEPIEESKEDMLDL